MFQGKMKAVTFSYDDGVTQDIRLAELFHKYGLKATFNLNYNKLGKEGALVREGWSVNHTKNAPADVPHIYAGHEIAGHTLDHPRLPQWRFRVRHRRHRHRCHPPGQYAPGAHAR